ncbi:DUF2914 domain-containing protein [Patescibacteria group bacterium]|nr:MAG: DUF2914 domain-containing protein [Patescibacteria group bacterium]
MILFSPVLTLRSWFERYERALVPGLLVAGFFVDVVTFRTLQVTTTLSVLGAYALAAAAAIAYANAYDARPAPPKGRVWSAARLACPLAISFAFGALLSSSFLFYWYSGSLSASWPLMAFFVALMTSNEALRHVFLRPRMQIVVFAFVLLSYFSLLFPFVFNTLESWAFLLAGAASTVAVLSLISLIARFSPAVRRFDLQLTGAALFIVAAMDGLYFLNMIPPIPLSIRDAGIYHDLARSGDGYALLGEEESFLASVTPGQALGPDEDGRLYAYTAIFAPPGLSAVIAHRWERFDEAKGDWVLHARHSFPITGGRDAGYRGYSYALVAAGRWRVTVETERGQVLGRLSFTYAAR